MEKATAFERLKNLGWEKTYDNYDDPELIQRKLKANREAAEANKKYKEYINSKPQELIDEYHDWIQELEEDEEGIVGTTPPTYEDYTEIMYGGGCFEPVFPEKMITARQITFTDIDDEYNKVFLDFYWKSIKVQSYREVCFGDEPPNEIKITFTEMEAFIDYIRSLEEGETK